jgi:hypothetical protein
MDKHLYYKQYAPRSAMFLYDNIKTSFPHILCDGF